MIELHWPICRRYRVDNLNIPTVQLSVCLRVDRDLIFCINVCQATKFFPKIFLVSIFFSKNIKTPKWIQNMLSLNVLLDDTREEIKKWANSWRNVFLVSVRVILFLWIFASGIIFTFPCVIKLTDYMRC